MLAVRDQNLSPEIFHKVARRFGPFSGNRFTSQWMASTSFGFAASQTTQERSSAKTGTWISLGSKKPPGTTMLYGEVVPPVGGDTCFSSLERAYDSLSPRMVALLEGLTGVHSGKGVFEINAATKELALRRDAQTIENIEVEHPVVCVHPVTGKRYVFVSSVLTHFKGMTPEESKPIIDFLLFARLGPSSTVWLRWEERTLGM